MTRSLALAAIAAGALFAPALAPATLMAQDTGERVNQVIIYGDDPCPPSTGDTITVCARMDEDERFRIPSNLRQSGSPENTAWAQKVRSFEAVGAFGPLSCTPVGAGGELGCTVQAIETAYAERATGRDVRMSELINEARAERLSEIDAEAAATQARVEVLERAYMDRIAREQQAGLPEETPDPAQPVAVQPAEVTDPAALPQDRLAPPDLDDDAE